MAKLLYPKLSYQIVGVLFDVYNQLKFGHQEKIYQKAVELELKKKKISFKPQIYFPIEFNNQIISKYYFDFLIENKVILELKVAKDFFQRDINQILSYLKSKGFRLGILALFTKEGIKFKRILN